MDAISLGLGTLVVVVLVIAVAALLVVTRLFRKVEQGKALIVSKMRKVDVTFTGQVVLPVLHKAEVMDISVKTIEISRTGRDGLICKDNIRADIRISFFVRVNKTVEDVIKVAQAIGTQRASDKATLQELFDQHRQQEQADGTRQDLERLALGGLLEGRVVDGEDVEEDDVRGVERMVTGGHPGRHGEGRHRCRDTGQRPAQSAREEGADRKGGSRETRRRARSCPGHAGDGFKGHDPPARRGGHGPVVGQELRAAVAAPLGSFGAGRVACRRRQQRQREQPGVGDLPPAGWGALHRAQQQTVGLDDLAGSGDRGGREGRGRGVGVRQDGRRRVKLSQVESGLGDDGCLVQQLFQVLAQSAVVQTDDQPETRIQPSRHESGPYVGLVVLVHQGQGGGPGDTGGRQHVFVGLGRLDEAEVP